MAIKDLNNKTPFKISKINGVSDDNLTGINGVTYDPDAGKIYNDVIAYSAIFDDSSATRLTRTYNATATVDAQICTCSFWVKRSTIDSLQLIMGGKQDSDNKAWIGFTVANQFEMAHRRAGTWQTIMITNRIFVDTASWYHFHYIYDSDQSTQTDRITLTINGVDYDAADSTLWATYTLPGSGEACRMLEDNEPHWVSGYPDEAAYVEGYLADVYCLEGVAVPYTNFGEFVEGIWVPKDYTVGTNGEGELSYKLDFSNSSHFGEDQSVNANDFTDTNMGTDHQVVDTPENNFCTLNYLNSHTTTDGLLGDGALNAQYSGSTWVNHAATFLMRTGQWYWEVDIGSDTLYVNIGIVPNGEESGNFQAVGNTPPGYTSIGYGFKTVDASNYGAMNNNSTTNDDNLDAPAANDIMTVAFDADEGKIWFGLYNSGSGHVWGDFGATGVGDPAAGTNPAFSGIDAKLYDYVPCISVYAHITSVCNFGQRAFSGTQPTGFKTLCNANILEPDYREPYNEAMNIVLWDGDSGSTKSITGVGFQPDLVWLKARDGAYPHIVTDSVRGVNLALEPDSTAAETDEDANGYISSFDSDGFTLTDGSGSPTNTHVTGTSYVGWCFKKGPEYGIDIQTYSGSSVAKNVNHSLGVVPELIIVKGRTQAAVKHWYVYHHHADEKADPETDYGLLSVDNAWADSDTIWNDTAPTQYVFTVGTEDGMNDNGYTYLALLFASIDGFSKVFSYDGNGGVASAPFIHCGFQPRFILLKNVDGTNSWRIYDTERNTMNGFNMNALYPDVTNVEATTDLISMSILSNGFKVTVSTAFINQNNATIVGIAFAEFPYKYANAR